MIYRKECTLEKKEGKDEGNKEKKEKRREKRKKEEKNLSLFTLETERMVQGEEHGQLWRHTHAQCVINLERAQAPSKFYIKNVWPNTLFGLTLGKGPKVKQKEH